MVGLDSPRTVATSTSNAEIVQDFPIMVSHTIQLQPHNICKSWQHPRELQATPWLGTTVLIGWPASCVKSWIKSL